MSSFNFTTTIERTSASMHFIKVPEEIAEALLANNHRRVLCIYNSQLNIHASLTNKKGVGQVLHFSKKTLKALKVQAGETVDVQIQPDESPLQFAVPEEFSEVMATDPEAQAIFDQLTDGRKRSLIYLVSQAKRSDTRITRALKIAE